MSPDLASSEPRPKSEESAGLATDPGGIDLSVVMPCLNERDTLETCIRKAQRAMAVAGIQGEVVVADNGSSDGSQAIARACGARVVNVSERGYGNALRAGIAASRGTYVLMGDADDSYDFSELAPFYDKLRQGYDIVQGCRLPRGGGTINPGAMPFLHRWLGNPMFSRIANKWFEVPVSDIYCGMRGFRRDVYDGLALRCTGMEFATEMLIRASLSEVRIGEVPITLHKDGRVAHPPHLRTFRDGWRTLRFFLLYSPRWLFLFPGLTLIALGALGYVVVYSRLTFSGMHFDAHSLLFASLAAIMGYQAVLFAVSAWTFATAEGLMPMTPRLRRWYARINLERGVILGVLAMLAGSALLVAAILQWRRVSFGELNYAETMRVVIPGVTLTALGFQTVLMSFFLSLLGMRSLATGTPASSEE
jgi:glycosyltransferase involved in cell wall biosynthesis